MTINLIKLNAELTKAGIPFQGVADVDGTNAHVRIDFAPQATPTQRQQAAAIVAAHDPTDTDLLARQAALAQAKAAATGVTLDPTAPTNVATAAAQITALKALVHLLQAQVDGLAHGDPIT